MNKIVEYYQPFYDAIEEYKKIDNKLQMRDRAYNYLKEQVDKNKGKKKSKKKQKKKRFIDYIMNAMHKKYKAWEKVFTRGAIYLAVWLISEIIYFGFLAPVNVMAVITSLLSGAIFLGLFEYKAVAEAIRKSKDVVSLADYQAEYKDLDMERVDDVIDMLMLDTYKMRERKRDLEDYISSCEQKICEESGVLANQILETHGINAEIELRPKLKQLEYHEKEKEG